MKNAVKIAAAACAVLALEAVLPAFAEDKPPMPKMFRAMQKGQWKMDVLEHSAAKSGKALPSMTVCTDNLFNESSKGAAKGAETNCKRRLVKDSADEAVMESVCPERASTVTMKREGAKGMLVEIK